MIKNIVFPRNNDSSEIDINYIKSSTRGVIIAYCNKNPCGWICCSYGGYDNAWTYHSYIDNTDYDYEADSLSELIDKVTEFDNNITFKLIEFE